MRAKAVWILVLLTIVLGIPFIDGLFGGFISKSVGNTAYIPDFFFYYPIVIVLLLGIYALVHFIRKYGLKGLLIAIVIIAVLIPLAFLGTCALEVAGSALKELFI